MFRHQGIFLLCSFFFLIFVCPLLKAFIDCYFFQVSGWDGPDLLAVLERTVMEKTVVRHKCAQVLGCGIDRRSQLFGTVWIHSWMLLASLQMLLLMWLPVSYGQWNQNLAQTKSLCALLLCQCTCWLSKFLIVALVDTRHLVACPVAKSPREKIYRRQAEGGLKEIHHWLLLVYIQAPLSNHGLFLFFL